MSAVVAVDPLSGVDSVHSRNFVNGQVSTMRFSSWSAAGHNHKNVIGQDPICASQHDMGLDLSENG